MEDEQERVEIAENGDEAADSELEGEAVEDAEEVKVGEMPEGDTVVDAVNTDVDASTVVADLPDFVPEGQVFH